MEKIKYAQSFPIHHFLQSTQSVNTGAKTSFNVLVNDLDQDDGTQRTLSKFASEKQWTGLFCRPEVSSAVQRDLSSLEKRSGRNLIKFHKKKHRPAPGKEQPHPHASTGQGPACQRETFQGRSIGSWTGRALAAVEGGDPSSPLRAE